MSDRVLVELDPERKQTSSGIVIPDTSPAPLRTGMVKMVGPGRQYRDCYRPTEIKVGERVAFFIGSTDTLEGKEITYRLNSNERLIRENDILFVTTEDVEISL